MESVTTSPIVAISGGLVIGEVIVALIIVSLGAVILILKQRSKKPAKTEAPSAVQNMYADLAPPGMPGGQQAPGTAGFGGSTDPFAAFTEPPPGPPPAPPAPGTGGPPPGTPAGWLPDPSGAPNTLRYWDGSAWTAHVAQRS
jgi:hypothetical protein